MSISKGLIITIVVVIAAISIGFVINHSGSTQKAVADDPNLKIIHVNATSFLYEPGTITVKQGDHVRIVINNVDKNHGISIPELNVSGLGEVDFVASQKGTFDFHCPTFCGSGHKEMTGTLIIE